ncbi:two-component regulator propeller domain-containing protein [Pontibacter liquoris]|uniref:two-component regulator propeller domain-containing protein n=1 Tax=Pontibacter liquoris TaxID=2905677 RepID=UPI001FA7969E|nr:two-component regulator propeller domain-containing protein [Pontibacter liquoris]
MYLLRLSLLLCLLAPPHAVWSQQYNFRNWMLEDGLPQSQVNGMLQDDKKQLWLATRGGVSKFDGSTFLTYTRQQGLSSNNISCLFQDSRKRLWIGTSDHGLNLYTNQHFRHFNSLPDTGILAVAEDATGQIWVATKKGLYFLADNGFRLYSQLPLQPYTALLTTPAGEVWVGSKTAGLYALGKQPRHYTAANSDLGSNSITSLLLHQGQVWVGTQQGLARISKGKLTRQRLPRSVSSPAVSSFTQDQYGNLWIGLTTDGLLKLSNDSITHITRQNGLRTNHVTALASDTEGNVWIGTDGYGLQQYKAPWFVHYFDFAGNTESRVTALAQDMHGRVWLGTDDGHAAYVQDGNKLNWLYTDVWPVGTTLYNMWVQNSDNVWVCTSNGLWNLTPKTVRHYTVADGLPSNTIYQCMPDSAGNLWFATANGVATRTGNTFRQVTTGTADSPQRVFCILNDRKNNLWFGTESGVYRLVSGKLQRPPELSAYPMEEVTAMAEDKTGNLYFGAFNFGIVVLRAAKDSYLVNSGWGLPNEGVRNLYVDTADNLWVGTSRNLLKIQLDSLRRKRKLSYRVFSYQDGFRGIEVGYNAITQTPDGTMWFGTAKGLTKYLPQLDRPNKECPQLLLTDILLYQKPTEWRKLGYKTDSASGLPLKLHLPFNQNHVTFSFHGISLSSPTEVRYKYRLVGNEEQWSAVTRQTYATYANLGPGKYTFELMARNGDGIWTPQPLTYTFTIVPPIWRREWFIGLMLLVLAGIILSVVRLREQNLVKMNSLLEMKVRHRTTMLERKNLEKETLLQEIHHRVKNNLQIVISLVNLQARHVEDPQTRDVMRAIQSRVRSMAILHERLYRHDDLGQIDLEDYFKGICESLYAAYGIDPARIALHLQILPIKTDIDSAITLGLIVNELVSNSLKYAFPNEHNGALWVSLKYNDNQHYTLVVADNGKGLPDDFASRKSQSFGLQLVSTLSRKLKGEMYFENNNGTKSTLHFVLPS